MTPLLAAAREHLTALLRAHPFSETVYAFTPAIMRLIRPLHYVPLRQRVVLHPGGRQPLIMTSRRGAPQAASRKVSVPFVASSSASTPIGSTHWAGIWADRHAGGGRATERFQALFDDLRRRERRRRSGALGALPDQDSASRRELAGKVELREHAVDPVEVPLRFFPKIEWAPSVGIANGVPTNAATNARFPPANRPRARSRDDRAAATAEAQRLIASRVRLRGSRGRRRSRRSRAHRPGHETSPLRCARLPR